MKYLACLTKTYVFIVTANLCSCWNFFPSMIDYNLKDTIPDISPAQLEYIYGDCQTSRKHFYTHIHLDNKTVAGQLLLRGWLNITRSPTCVIVRGIAIDPEQDVFKSTAYSFQLCLPRVIFCHSQRRYIYYYYEWFIPYDLVTGINWDLYFYGPKGTEWE